MVFVSCTVLHMCDMYSNSLNNCIYILCAVSMVAMSTFRSNMGAHREGGDMRTGDPVKL